MTTPIEALQQVAESNLGFYAFCFADEIAVSDVQAVVEWGMANNRAFMTVVTDRNEATSLAASLDDNNVENHLITYHEDYTTVGAFAGFALDQRYDIPDGVKTLHMKSVRGVAGSALTQSQAAELTAAGVNFYSNYGNPDNSVAIYTNGFAGGGRYFDFVMGMAWLRNNIETKVFNGQRARRTTPQNNKGAMMIKSDIITAMDEAVNAGLIGEGRWNGEAVGEVETFDYLPNGYYIYNSPVYQQSQEDRDARIAPPFIVLAKGAGSFHGVDITIIPQT